MTVEIDDILSAEKKETLSAIHPIRCTPSLKQELMEASDLYGKEVTAKVMRRCLREGLEKLREHKSKDQAG